MKTEETTDREEWWAEMNDYKCDVWTSNDRPAGQGGKTVQETFLRNVWDERDEEVESLREEITCCLNEF